MELVILVIHVFLAAGIIGVILLQPPESGSLGGLGGSNPMAGVNSRGQGNLLTRITWIFAFCFIITSLTLAWMSGHKPNNKSILDAASASAVTETTTTTTEETPAAAADKDAKAETPAAEKSAAPATAPSVPLSK